MTPKTTHARALLAAGPINPRTGRLWSLTDSELAPLVREVERRILRSPQSAREFLRGVWRRG